MPNGVIPVGSSVNDTVPINHSIPLSSFGVMPVGSSVNDTVPIQSFDPAIIIRGHTGRLVS
jgi:hypothetical protein